MWLLSRIGALEVLVLFLAVALGCCFGRRGLRWLAAIGPLLILSILLSGPDLFGMLCGCLLLDAGLCTRDLLGAPLGSLGARGLAEGRRDG